MSLRAIVRASNMPTLSLTPREPKFTAEGAIKVLDFGLGKALEAEPNSDSATSPTMTLAATRAGIILGTAGYMSPEQANSGRRGGTFQLYVRRLSESAPKALAGTDGGKSSFLSPDGRWFDSSRRAAQKNRPRRSRTAGGDRRCGRAGR